MTGTIALSAGLLNVLEALYDARVPKEWLARSWEANSLGAWFLGLLQRHEQLLRWLTTGRPASFWLPGFFNPQGFLTAVKQEVNRRHAADKWALDDVVMTAEVLHPLREADQVREPPKEGVYVHGLFLEGAALDKGAQLVDSEPKKLYFSMPVIHVTGIRVLFVTQG